MKKITSLLIIGAALVSTSAFAGSNKNDQNEIEICKNIIGAHGMLTRAQFQCGFSKYGEGMMQDVKDCSSSVSAKEFKKLLTHGMELFDIKEKERGHEEVCDYMLAEFPNVVAR